MEAAPINAQAASVAMPQAAAAAGLSFAQWLQISSQRAISAQQSRKNASALTQANGAEAIDDFAYDSAKPMPRVPIDYLRKASKQDFADMLTLFACEYNDNSQKKLHAALRSAVRLLIADPENRAATDLLVRTLANREAVQDAEAFEAIVPNPDFAHYHSMFALLFMAAKRADEAHKELALAVAAGEEHALECQTIFAAIETDGSVVLSLAQTAVVLMGENDEN